MLATFPEGESKGLEKQRKTSSVCRSRQLSRLGSQEGGLMIRLLFCGNDGQRFLRSDSCRTRKSTYPAARALPFSESSRKLSISSDSAPGNVAATRLCRCGSSVSLNISSTETLKKRERRNKADAVASLRPFSDFAIADRLSPWRWLIVVDLNFFLCVSRLTFQRISYLDFIK